MSRGKKKDKTKEKTMRTYLNGTRLLAHIMMMNHFLCKWMSNSVPFIVRIGTF